VYNDFRALDPSKYLDEVSPGRTATVVIAAVDASLQARAQADFVCDGVADDVEINAALNILPASGGRVMLSEGTFVLAAPIVFPANNIWLRGMGRPTLIDGDALTTGNHAISLTGRTGCAIKKLTIQTQTGGGKTCHCIFADDGCNNLSIHDVTIVDSDSDGIHIEGTNVFDIHIRGLRVDDVDDYGIYVGMDGANFCDRLMVDGALVLGAGLIGIRLGDCRYSEVSNSVSALNTQSGFVLDSCSHCDISNCISVLNTQHGIIIAGTTHCNCEGCNASLNVRHGIYLNSADECQVGGCTCTGNDSTDSGTYDGINVDGDSDMCNIVANHCCNNDRYGIMAGGAGNSIGENYCRANGQTGIHATGTFTKITGNYLHENGYHGIYAGALQSLIEGNYCDNNGTTSAGTYHGICLGADADRSSVVGNFIWADASVTAYTEDGVHLSDGAINCSIIGNYCYDLLGDGIYLAGNNTGTLIEGNNCWDMNDENGIVVQDSTDCNINGNHCNSNKHHGIYLRNADRASVVGNTCNDNGDITPANYDGINVNADCDECLLDANIVNGNHRYGINIMGGARHIVSNNQVNTNQLEGIICAGADTIISGNWCFDNGQKTPGTYHGIDLAGTADRCQVNGNHIDGNGDATEDGIHLESGAIDCQINDNYIYNMMGSGICLAADNLDCEISGNYVRNCDDYGIEVLDGADRCLINNNKCYGNANHGIYLNANDYCTIVGNICNGNTGDTTDGINLNGCDYCTVSGNVCTGNGDDGIVLVATSTKCIIIGNQLLGNTGAALTDGGTDTEIGHNITV